MLYKVKICGITNREDLELVAEMGADYGGVLIDLDFSPRSKTLESAGLFCVNTPLPLVNLTFNKDVDGNLKVAETLKPVALQLHGQETPETAAGIKKRCDCEIWKVIHLPFSEEEQKVDIVKVIEEIGAFSEAGADKFLFDASGSVGGKMKFGGTGKTVNWQIVREIKDMIDSPVILAGGIKPDNVIEALSAVEPYGVDLSSGVEKETGKKDPALVQELIESVRSLG